MRTSYSPESPFDTTTINPITPSLHNPLETGKMKTYRVYTFTLCIPLELEDEDHPYLKMGHLSWFHLFGEDLPVDPPYSTMESVI